MNDKKFLSQRIRRDSEAAPWVVEEVKKIEQENEKLKNIITHLFSDRTGVYFICGESGDKDEMGLPEHIFVCPSYGLDGMAIYTKTKSYSSPEY